MSVRMLFWYAPYQSLSLKKFIIIVSAHQPKISQPMSPRTFAPVAEFWGAPSCKRAPLITIPTIRCEGQAGHV